MRQAKRLRATLAITLIIAAAPVYAQGKGKKELVVEVSPETRAKMIRKSFETEMGTVLEKFLKPHQYNLQVNFDLAKDKKGGDDVPYAPDNIVPDAFQGLPTAKQMESINNLNIVLQVPKWVDNDTKQTLKSVAERDLSEKLGKPMAIKVESVALDVEEPQKNQPQIPPPAPAPQASSGGAASSAELNRAMDDIRDLKKKLEEANKDAAKAAEAAAAKNAGDLGSATGKNPEGNGTGTSWISDLVAIGKQYPLPTAIGLALLYFGLALLIFIPSRSLVSSFKIVQSAFDTLSRAIKSMGESFGGKKDDEEDKDKAAEDVAKDMAEEALSAAAAGAADGGSVKSKLSIAELTEKIEALRGNHKPEYDRFVADLVVNYLHEPARAYWSVFLLDMLGRDHARRIFESLDSADQEEVMRLVKHEAPGDKLDATAELLDSYQMRLLTFGWKGGIKSRSLDAELQHTISQLPFEDLPGILNRLREPAIRRFLLYMDSKALGQLIRSVRRNPDSQRLIVALLARMPESVQDPSFDQEIRAQVQAHFSKKQDDLYLPYLTQYEEVVGQVGDELEDDVIELLNDANPEVGRYLKKKLVTMGTFFAMTDAEKKDILSSFTNNDFASLISSLDDEQLRTEIINLLEATRKEMIVEQLSVLAEESKLDLAERHKLIRKRIRTLIKQTRAGGGETAAVMEDAVINPIGHVSAA
ncbi:MAG: hypothetical protein H7318_17045 [Oligoflexus sp.]|nr:hypothetical protein [Oligoflexus sp.]